MSLYLTTTIPYQEQKDALENRTADLFGGYITIIPGDVWKFDITPSYYYDSINFICPRPHEMSVWTRIFNIYPSDFWILFGVATIISSVVTKTFYRIPYEDKLLTLIELLVAGLSTKAKTNIVSKRMLFGAWLLFSMIVSAIFKNCLVVINETSRKTATIDTLDDIIKSKLPIASMFDLRPYYDVPEGQKQLDYSSIRTCVTYGSCLNHVVQNRNLITTGGKSIAIYYSIPQLYIKTGEIAFHVSKEPIYSFHLHLLFTKGHPLFEPCSKIILKSMSNGWFAKEFADMRYRVSLATSKVRIKSKTISLYEIGYAFYIWLAGVLLAGLVFGVEQAYYRIRHLAIN